MTHHRSTPETQAATWRRSRRGTPGPSARRLGAVAAVLAGTLAVTAITSPVANGTGLTVQGAFAWGNNETGELGDGTLVFPRTTPSPTVGQTDLVAISSGMVHNLGIRRNGSVLAWGHNRSGQIGDGSNADRPTPVAVAGLSNMVAVSAGNAFSLGLRRDGAVFSWGNNKSGQLGNANAPTDRSTPVPVIGLGAGSGVVAVAAGGAHALALKSDGSVLAWGNNALGELGDGKAPTDRAKPGAVQGLGPGSRIVAIAAGASFSMALRADGTVFTWGNNASGQLGKGRDLSPIGTGKALPNSSVPHQVPAFGPGSGVVRIAAGEAFSLALKSNGQVFAWGNNQSGQLGDGNAPNDRTSPTPVPGVTGVVAISAGRSHAIALAGDGRVWTWGANNLGQIGNGGQSPAIRPVRITAFGGKRIVLVSAGGDHTHALFGIPASTGTPPPSGVIGGGTNGLPPTGRADAVNKNPGVTG